MSLFLSNLYLFASIQYGLPQGLLSSICYVESKHDISAYHKHDGKGNSVGVCQVKIQTAMMLGFRGSEKELMEPSTNVMYAAKYLQHQLIRYDGDTVAAIISYNRGSKKLLTRTDYSDKVIKYWENINAKM